MKDLYVGERYYLLLVVRADCAGLCGGESGGSFGGISKQLAR